MRIFSIFQEAWSLVIAKELDHGWQVCPPVFGPALQIYEDGYDAGLVEKRDGVLKILVEIGIEDALIHEVQTGADIEQDPTEIMKAQRREQVWVTLHCVFKRPAVRANSVFPSGLDLGNDRKAIVCRSSRIDWTVAALLNLEVSVLRDRHGCRLRPAAGTGRCRLRSAGGRQLRHFVSRLNCLRLGGRRGAQCQRSGSGCRSQESLASGISRRFVRHAALPFR